MILLEHRKDIISMETVEVVDEYSSLTHPLAVELAPESFAPACIGDSEVQTVRIGILPVACCNIVTERVLIAVEYQFGVARCTGAEEDEHGIGAAGSLGGTLKMSAVCGEFLVEIMP